MYRRQGSRPSPWKRNAKKTKWLSGEASQIAVKRREAKSKGKKERYKHLKSKEQQEEIRKTSSAINAKKQRKTTEWEKLENSSRKLRDTKGTFHAKMGSIKDRKGMDLTEAEDIKKRWQEYTEELYEKDLHDPDNNDDVIIHLEPDILECEVK